MGYYFCDNTGFTIMKRFFRPFMASFMLTLLLMGFAGGFLAVEASTSTYGLQHAVPLLSWEWKEPLDMTISVMGNTLRVPMKELNTAAAIIQKYATVLIPRPLRLAGQGITYGAFSYQRWYEEDLERRYQESIQ